MSVNLTVYSVYFVYDKYVAAFTKHVENLKNSVSVLTVAKEMYSKVTKGTYTNEYTFWSYFLY